MKIFTDVSENFTQDELIKAQSNRSVADMRIDRLIETFPRESDITDLYDTEIAVYVSSNFGLLRRGWHRVSIPNVVSFFDADYNLYILSRLSGRIESIENAESWANFIKLHVAKQNRKRFRNIVMNHFFSYMVNTNANDGKGYW